MKCRYLFIILLTLASVQMTGCDAWRRLSEDYDKTKSGLGTTLSGGCSDAIKATPDADEVLRLVSSEDNTVFTIDGKEVGRAKQLKVCVNGKAKHTVVATPPGCDEKIESLSPPYDFPMYEFRFMLAECKGASSPTTTAPQKKSTRKRTN